MAGFLLRLWWVHYATRTPAGLHDPTFYLDYGTRMAQGGGYRLATGEPTAYYPIGYPAALAVVFWVVLHTPIPDNLPLAATTFNLVLGTATIVAMGVLARRLAGAWIGVAAAALVAFFPNLIFHTAAILTETLFNFLLVSALLVLLWRPWREAEPSNLRLAGFGLLLGLSVLVRPVALMVLPLLAVVWLVRGGGWRRWVARMAIVTGVVLLVMLPWVVRNAAVMHEATFATTTGDNLCIGNNPDANGAFQLPDWCFHDFISGPRPEFETRRDHVLTSRALDWITSHPAQQPRLLAWRTWYTFVSDHDGLRAVQSYEDDPFISQRRYDTLAALADGYYFVVLGFGLAGLLVWVTRREPRRVAYLAVVVAMAIAPWPFFGDTRFHLPVSFLLCLPAAVVLVGLRSVRRRVSLPPSV